MTVGSSWTRARSLRPFLGRFSHYFFRLLPWIPPAIMFNQYVGEPTFINGPSMYPFLNDQYNSSLKQDICWNHKLYAGQDLEPGMIVTFR